MWQQLSNKIKSTLESNTLIQEVYDWEVNSFEGDPVVTVVPSSNESDYTSTTENRRVYAMNLTLFVDRTTRSDQDCERITRQICDSILDDFDKDYILSGIEVPTGYTMLFLEAVPSAWGYFERENIYRVATITLRAHFDVDVNLIS